MGAFDIAVTPVAVTPANTSEVALFTAGLVDASIMVEVCAIDAGVTARVRVGITPSGGSVHWKVWDALVVTGNPILSLGPFTLNPGAAMTVRTDTASKVTFSATGVESS